MPLKTGIEIAADLKTNGSEVKVVLITAHDDEYFRDVAFSVGASAFIKKTRLGDELIPAIESAYPGKVLSSPDSNVTKDLKKSRS